MRYAQEFRIPDPYDTGSHDLSKYLCVNSAGFYEIEKTHIPIRKIFRKNGRLDYLLCYVHDGRMKVHFDRQEHTLEKGFFIIKPHIENYYWQDTYDNYEIYWVHFTGYGAGELLDAANLSDGGVFGIGACDDLPHLFDMIIKEVGQKNPGYENISASLLMLIISLLGRKVSKQEDTSQNTDPRVKAVIDYIRKQYYEKISVKTMAEMAGLSESHFARLFREQTKMYPLQYVIKFRLQKSCELMQHANLSIKEIAMYVGFEDPLYFSRLFKKHIGITPTEYINNLRNDNFFIFTPEPDMENDY